jgi:NAD(P)-dependent dehydrogenase (short-subunit alcohol dehydrogenase family)
LALARGGADLFLVDNDESNLRASACAAKRFKSKVVVAVRDLSQTAQVTAMVNACRASCGGLDILVNSAGIVDTGPLPR